MSFRPSQLPVLLSILASGSGWAYTLSDFSTPTKLGKNIPTLTVNLEPNKPDSGEACQYLKSNLAQVRAWTRWLGEEPRTEATCYESRSQIHLSLSGSSPRFTEEMQGRSPSAEGPNCYNNALLLNRIVDSLRFVSEREMTFWLKSPLCQEISAPGLRAVKTFPLLGVVYSRYDGTDPVHATHFISDQIVFDKADLSRSSSYEFTRPQRVFATAWRISDRCVGWNHPFDSQECLRWVRYYQCEKLPDYVARQPKKPNPEWQEARNEFRQITQEFEQVLKSQELPTRSKAHWIQARGKLLQLETFAQLQREIYPARSLENLLWTGLLLGTESAIIQARFLSDAAQP
jgi:hypothetical protein